MAKVPEPFTFGPDRPAPRDPGVPAHLFEQASAVNLIENIKGVVRNLEERRQDAADNAFFNDLEAQSSVAAQNLFDDMKKKAGEGAPDFTENFEKALRASQDKMFESLSEKYKPSQDAVFRGRRYKTGIHASALVRAASFENNARVAQFSAALEDNLKRISVDAANAPETWKKRIEDARAAIERSSELLLPEKETELMQKWPEAIAESAILSLIEKDPNTALRNLNAGEYDDYIGGPAKTRFIAAASAQIKQNNATLDAQANAMKKNDYASMRATGVVNPENEFFIERVQGPEAAEEYRERINFEAQTWGAIQTMQSATVEDIGSVLQEFKPAGGEGDFILQASRFSDLLKEADRLFKERGSSLQNDIVSVRETGEVDPENEQLIRTIYGDKQADAYKAVIAIWAREHELSERILRASPEEVIRIMTDAGLLQPGSVDTAQQVAAQAALNRAGKDELEARANDPMAVAMRNMPGPAKALTGTDPFSFEGARGGGDPAAQYQAYLSMLMQEQERLGIHPDATRTMSRPMAAAFVTNLMEADPEDRVDMFANLEQMYGDLYDKALRDLSEYGELDMNHRMLAIHADNKIIAASIARSLKIDEKELKAAIPDQERPAVLAEINGNISQHLDPFFEVFNAGGNSEETLPLNLGITEATRRLALLYHFEGHNPADAARKASEDMILNRYQVHNTSRVKAAIPANVNTGLIDRAAETLVQTDKLIAFGPVPPRGSTLFAGENVKARFDRSSLERSRLYASIDDFGVFIADSKGTGLALAIPIGTTLQPVVNSEGENYSFTWAELEELGMSSPRILRGDVRWRERLPWEHKPEPEPQPEPNPPSPEMTPENMRKRGVLRRRAERGNPSGVNIP